jgi:hypothetical protein
MSDARRVRSLTRYSNATPRDFPTPCWPLSLTEGEQCLLEALCSLICVLARISLAHCDRCSPLRSTTQYNHWEDDDYNRYLSDLFWDDMLDTAPWMREA